MHAWKIYTTNNRVKGVLKRKAKQVAFITLQKKHFNKWINVLLVNKLLLIKNQQYNNSIILDLSKWKKQLKNNKF